MDAEDLAELVSGLRKFGAEGTSVEAKLSTASLPKSVRETLSSFSNTPGGGVLVLGLDEKAGFAPVGVPDPAKLQADLASSCREDVVPPLAPEISVVDVAGRPLVVAEISELPRQEKPCYVRSLGLQRGSYLRVGESDRRLTSEEVQQIVADRGQPMFDQEVVPGAGPADLDPSAVGAYLARLRRSNPRLFADETDETVLRLTKVLVRTAGGEDGVTLAGLLALARYPQQFFPQLNLTFVHYPTTSGAAAPGGVRFLDNVSLNGPLPLLASEALRVITRNMSRRALVAGVGRRDVWEYPPEAVREAVVNALVHRDLSPGARGTQVQVEMFPDRLRIGNPGGLFGPIDLDRLGEEGRSSARNSVLMKVLEDVVVPGEDRTVCENRGSGVRAMIAALRDAGMSVPRFRDGTTTFEVEMPNHTLLDEDTVRWLNSLGREGLKDSQCTALALLRRGEVLDNSRYRAATGTADSRTATVELQDLVARELVDQTGTRGGTRYTLSDHARQPGDGRRRHRSDRPRQITELLATRGELSKTEISLALELNPKTAEHWLRALKGDGQVVSTAVGKSKGTRYRLSPQDRLDLDEPSA